MARSSSIICDVCGKRAGERISDWFEIDAGQDGFYIAHQTERPAGITRASKDICGSRCLCVALERWVNKHLRMNRATAPQAAGDDQVVEPERIGPRIAQPTTPLVRETNHRGPAKPPKNPPPVDILAPDDNSRLLEVFRRAVTR